MLVALNLLHLVPTSFGPLVSNFPVQGVRVCRLERRSLTPHDHLVGIRMPHAKYLCSLLKTVAVH